MEEGLSGRVALVTGGTRGIGAAIARRLLTEGARVIVTGTRAEGRGPDQCLFRRIDFLDRHGSEIFATEVAEMGLDILINNAGINRINQFERIEPADFDDIHQVNVRAPFLLCRAVIPGMKERGWGRIVNVTSIFGKISKEYRASYSASKFGLDGMTIALAAEVSSYGILVNCVAPGFIDTELTRSVLSEDERAELAGRVPVKRLGTPDEVAVFVAWLAGPDNTYITGQNIAIDGGFSRV
jgi:NAD(P)-dependent dehydrogenase (short-subunit alcohol dehydrogenase family)